MGGLIGWWGWSPGARDRGFRAAVAAVGAAMLITAIDRLPRLVRAWQDDRAWQAAAAHVPKEYPHAPPFSVAVGDTIRYFVSPAILAAFSAAIVGWELAQVWRGRGTTAARPGEHGAAQDGVPGPAVTTPVPSAQ
jgi:hypothetical protein